MWKMKLRTLFAGVICWLDFIDTQRTHFCRNTAWTMWFASRYRITAEDSNARSLRFRFKTFELDWETPWVFAVSPGHLKLSWQTISRPTSCSHCRNLAPCPRGIISECLFFLLLRSFCCSAFRSQTCWLRVESTSTYLEILETRFVVRSFLVPKRNNTWHVDW